MLSGSYRVGLFLRSEAAAPVPLLVRHRVPPLRLPVPTLPLVPLISRCSLAFRLRVGKSHGMGQ